MKTNKTIRRPLQKPKKPPTPAARKGGRKKENVGAGRSAYSAGGRLLPPLKNATKNKKPIMPTESKRTQRPGFSTGGTLEAEAAARSQQQAAQSSTGQGRILGPSTGPSRGPKLKTVTLAKPKPQESKVRKRPGFSHGGKVEMEVLKPN